MAHDMSHSVVVKVEPYSKEDLRSNRVGIHGVLPVSDARLFSFAQSSSTPMTWIPDTIPVQDLSKAYLRQELGILDKAIQSLSDRWFENAPADLAIPPLKVSWHLQFSPASSSVARREALKLTFQMRDLVEFPAPSWVHGVDIKLSHLATYLGGLQMYEETCAVHNLRIDLWTAMATVYPASDASARLVSALTNLAVDLYIMGDTKHSHMISNQAMNVIESKPEISRSIYIQILLAQHLAVESAHNQESSMALHLAESSVRQIEAVLGASNLPEIMPGNDKASKDGFSNVGAKAFEDSDTSDDALFIYASMLSHLSDAQYKSDLLPEAGRSAKRALTTLHHLSAIYPGSSRLLPLTATVLTFLAYPKLSDLNSIDEKLEYSQENEHIHTQLAQVDPQRYVVSLLSSLCTKQNLLLSMGKVRQAQQTHQKMISLGSMAADTYSNLKIPSETEGDYYFRLAQYHFSCRRFQDAIYAARNAISQYSALEAMTPGQSPVKHFLAAALMCKTLSMGFTNQYNACIAEGFKTLELLDKSTMRGSDVALIDAHMELLHKMMEALDATSDSRALEWAREINSRIQKLFREALPTGRKIVLQNAQAPSKYASILQKNDFIEEAAAFLQDTRRCWKDRYGGTNLDSYMIGISYLQCLMVLPGIFKAKGETGRALKYSQEAMDVAESFFSEGYHKLKPFIYNNLTSMHISLLFDAGRYPEALALSELVVVNARETEQSADNGTTILLQVLGSHTYCQLYSLKPHDAIATANEGISLSRKALADPHTVIFTLSHKLTMLYISLLTLADGLGDAGDVDQALVCLGEAKVALMKQEIASNVEVGSDAHSYQVIATKQSRLLLAKGEYVEAARLIEGVVATERERAGVRKSVMSSLIKALQVAGILYCTLGRHGDGILAATEVVDLKKSLAESPELASLVMVGEKTMISRGLWKSIQQAKDKLKCCHQDSTFGHF